MSFGLLRSALSQPTRGGAISGAAAVTTLAIGGSLATFFLSSALWLSRMGFATPGGSGGRPWTVWFVTVSLLLVLLPPFPGGWVWGWGLARMFDRPTRSAAKTGALAFGGMVWLTAAPTDLTQLWLDGLPTWMPWDVHGYFTVVFMVEVAVVGGVAAWRLAKRLGSGRWSFSVGVWTGTAAALGFLIGSVVAAAVGFRIYPWVRLSMVWAFLTALPFSTVAAGAVLGALLHQSLRMDTDEREFVARL